MKLFLTYGGKTEGPFTDPMKANERIQEIFTGKAHQEIRLDRADIVCDFCSWPVVHWTFSIEPGQEVVTYATEERTEHHMDSDGRWAACDECHGMIMAEDWEGMRKRSVKHATELNTMMRGAPEFLIEIGVRGSHDFFVANWDRSNKPVAVEDDAEFLASVGIEKL